MSKKQEPLRVELRSLLSRGGRVVSNLNSDGKVVPVPDEAELFQFDFVKDGENYGKVYVTIDGLHQLVVYFDDKVARSPKNGSTDSESWEQLVRTLKRFATQKQLSFQLSDQDNLENDMAKREYTKKQERVNEGYHSMGKKASYSDNVPTTKMIIKHTRNIEEGEQRYRNVEKIFIENADGERFLAPTTKPGIARVYARHVAEGGKPNDERWNHLSSLCEEYNKMAGFVRATRNGQFNESAQRLVTEGIAHYQRLRESLAKMSGKRGYNAYFESWTPPLMEAEEQIDLSEMFMTASLDPRIESVMPILGKLSKNLDEAVDMEETIALEAWADSLTDSKMGQSSLDNDDYVDPEEADYGDEYQDTVKRAGEFVKGVDQRAQARQAHKETEVDEGKGLWDNIHAKRERIKNGSGEHMRKPGSKGAPTADALRKSATEGMAEEVDTGQYDAVKSTPKGKEDDEVFKKFREKVRQYGDELGQRQKEKEVDEGSSQPEYMTDKNGRTVPVKPQKDGYQIRAEKKKAIQNKEQSVAEDLDANQKAAGQLGPTEKVGPNGAQGKLVGAMESTDPLQSILRLIK